MTSNRHIVSLAAAVTSFGTLAVPAVAAVALLLPASIARAQVPASSSPPPASSDQSQLTFLGTINADNTFLRSGPSADNNQYQVFRLDKAAQVVVVGIRNEWLQVVPPAGSFCVIDKTDVERLGNGSVARITNREGATVRLGSTIVPSRYKLSPNRLERGTDVKVIGEEDDRVKVAPPQGIYFWVERAAVTPVKRLDPAQIANQSDQIANNTQPQNSDSTPVTPPATPTDPANSFTVTSDDGTSPVSPGQTLAQNPGDNGTDPQAPETQNPGTQSPGTQLPNNAAIKALQDQVTLLEQDYANAGLQPITEQPVDELLARYQKLADDPQLPPNARQVVEFRLKALAVRKDALEQFKAVQQLRDDMNAKQTALQGEEKELRERAEASKVTRYTALGRLVTSSLQVGSQTLYRLVDPTTGRTVVYIRTNDANVTAALDKFVGVSGEVVSDDQINLTYVTPTKIEQVDPQLVNVRVFAEFLPPSMLSTNVTPVGVEPVGVAPVDAQPVGPESAPATSPTPQ